MEFAQVCVHNTQTRSERERISLWYDRRPSINQTQIKPSCGSFHLTTTTATTTAKKKKPEKFFFIFIFLLLLLQWLLFLTWLLKLSTNRGLLRFLLRSRNWISLKASSLTQLSALIHLGSHICSHLAYCRSRAAQSYCVMPSRHLSAPYESCVTHVFNARPWAWNAPLVFNIQLWN